MSNTYRLVLARRLLPALLHAHEREAMGATATVAVEELRESGAIEGDRLTVEAKRLAGLMTESMAVVAVDLVHPGPRRRSTLWLGAGETAWANQADGDRVELRLIDSFQVPLLIAQLTDLGHRPPAPFCGSVTVSDGALHDALGLRAIDPDAALDALVRSGLDDVWADRVLLAHDLRRAVWCVSSVSTDPTLPPDLKELEMLDAGAAGYWQIHRTGANTTFTATTLERVLAALRSIVPSPDLHEHSDAV